MASIWMLNQYAETPTDSGGTRHYELARHLVEMGHEVTIVCSDFHHASRRRRRRNIRAATELVNGVRFVWIGAGVTYQRNSLARALNMMEFALRAWLEGRWRFGLSAPKPNLIIGSSPHLLSAWAGLRLSKRFAVPFVFEIRDLWPETFIEMRVLSPQHLIVRLLRHLEATLVRRAVRVISLLPQVTDYLTERRLPSDHVVIVPNGVDAAAFACAPVEADRSSLCVTYVGAHGTANGLHHVLDAASRLLEEKDVEFHFYGDGPERKGLIERAGKEHLRNVFFHPAVPKSEVPNILCRADLLLLNYAPIGIGKYGISPNKLWEYMAACRPILFAHEAVENPVHIAQCGICVRPGAPDELASAIRQFLHLPALERQAMGERGACHAREHHDWTLLAARIDRVVQELVPTQDI